eukprot:995662_1
MTLSGGLYFVFIQHHNFDCTVAPSYCLLSRAAPPITATQTAEDELSTGVTKSLTPQENVCRNVIFIRTGMKPNSKTSDITARRHAHIVRLKADNGRTVAEEVRNGIKTKYQMELLDFFYE